MAGLTLGVLYGLIAMLGFGISDTLLKPVILRIGEVSAATYRGLFITSCLFLFALLTGSLVVPTLSTFLLLLLLGLLGMGGYYSFCKGLKVGELSVVSPISRAYIVITVLLAVIFFGESLRALQIAGIALVVLGAVGISFTLSHIKKVWKINGTVKSAPYGIITALSWGLIYFLLKIPVDRIGAVSAAFWFEGSILLFFSILYFTGSPPTVSSRDYGILILLAIFSAAGSLALSAGLAAGLVSVVMPIVAAVPLVTVTLSFFFLKERLELNQKIAVGVIFAGLVLLSL